MRNWRSKIGLILVLGLLTACSPKVENPQTVDQLPNIYPDYTNITIPQNIAPLNFMFQADDVEAVGVKLHCGAYAYEQTVRGKKIGFPMDTWKEILQKGTSKEIQVQTYARINGQWKGYSTFTWTVVPEEIDSYVTYRLIEPGYEVWNHIQIEERNITDFSTKLLADNSLLGNQCMNCHTHGGDQGQFSFFYIRGAGGGTILNRGKGLEKVTLKNSEMNGATVYGDFEKSGRYGVFSTNVIMPSFHSTQARRLEVYDTTSDLCVADFQQQRMILSPLTADSTRMETFPTFAPDGKTIYFCSSEKIDSLPSHVEQLHYSLCKIAFDPEKGEWGNKVDTLWNARTEKGSANFPKVSPDGKFLLFTRSDYGTFPIWHKEADLYLMNLATGESKNLKAANSNRSDTYHTWSVNSRWIAFASKRGDGQYGRVYFAYLDKNGEAHKAFVLPQEDPEKDLLNLKSYNIPDLSTVSMPYDAEKIAALNKELQATAYK